MILGEVTTFPYVEADKAQALKPLEEAAEVYAAWQEYDEATTLGDYRTLRLLSEIADCITACCNLAAAMRCEDMRPFLQMAETRNAERGRFKIGLGKSGERKFHLLDKAGLFDGMEFKEVEE